MASAARFTCRGGRRRGRWARSSSSCLSDEEGYRSFLRHLLAEGIVAPPDPVVLDVIMERQAQRVGNNANRLHEPSVKARHDRDAALLEQMEAAKAKLEQAPAPAPRRRRG